MFGLFLLFFIFMLLTAELYICVPVSVFSQEKALSRLLAISFGLFYRFRTKKKVFCLFAASHPDVGLFHSKQCYRLLATKLGCFELYLTQHVFTLLFFSLIFPRTTRFRT